MKKILFVCQANVGRSQMAEAFFNFHTGTQDASSAGVEDFREKYHHRSTMEIINTMLEKGIDISKQRINYLDQSMVKEADLIIVLCNKDLCPNFLLNSKKVIFREVKDPHQKSENIIRQIRDEIEKLTLKILNNSKNISGSLTRLVN